MLIEYGLTREELEQLALQACPAGLHYCLTDELETTPDQELIDIIFKRPHRDRPDDDTANVGEVQC